MPQPLATDSRRRQQHGRTSLDPESGIVRAALQLHVDLERGTRRRPHPVRVGVQRALVDVVPGRFLFHDRLEHDDGHQAVQRHGLGVRERHAFVVPAAPLDDQRPHVRALLRGRSNLRLVRRGLHDEVERELIDGDRVLPGRKLQAGGEEACRVGEGREPEDDGHFLQAPLQEAAYPLHEVRHPGGQRFQRRVGEHPGVRDPSLEQRVEHQLLLFGNHHEPLDTLLQLL
mmetsp:Transcript_16730/g.41427  ORF Transcript_16730/g.41427 Transcript_16730/m.41427 type:complete len:229 (+) Transcript_16730:478-1164(+)